VYSVTGEVRELRADGSNVVIRHEAIPGFMPAMTMSFTARDPRQIASLQAGDKVVFRLLVIEDESWIDSVERQGPPAPTPQFDLAQTRVVRDVEPLALGDVVPDYVFTNELGQPTRLSDFRGKAVGLTFIFTRCPLPEFCPRMNKNFAAVASALKARADVSNEWRLVTVTIDPAFDTPAVLKAYAERYDYDPNQWTFLTGALIDIDALTEQVGLVFQRQSPNALPDHNLRTVVIDPQGRLQKTIVGNTWKPEELVEDLVAAAAPDTTEAEPRSVRDELRTIP
jgi:protein SCO1/2